MPVVKPGESLALTLYWKPLRPTDQQKIAFFTHLADFQLTTWGQEDEIGYDSSQWRGGELAITRFNIAVSRSAPPGKYTLRTGLYSQKTMDRFQIVVDSGQLAGDVVPLPPIKVLPLKNEPPSPRQQVSAVFGSSAQLLGYDLGSGGNSAQIENRAGDRLGVTLAWKGLRRMQDDYTVFLHLVQPSGKVMAQADGQPARGAFPTSFWDEGEYVTDQREITLPSTLAAGKYDLVAGMYLLGTGERLRTETEADSVLLGTITVK